MPATILITGSSGLLGQKLAAAFNDEFEVVGLDRSVGKAPCEELEVDLTSKGSIGKTLAEVRKRHGNEIAAVLHLAAYYDFTGEPNPLYDKLNVEGTRLLLDALGEFDVEQFVYPSTMLVHAPGKPGLPIDETTRIAPAWVYPESKAAAEDVIRERRGRIPCAILRLAGVYSDTGGVPTLTHQIQRIYERTLKSNFYAGDASHGQAMVHIDDVIDAFERTVARRAELPECTEILIGEQSVLSYEAQQRLITDCLHGEETRLVELPPTVAKAGAWVEEHLEPVVPDAFDQGEKPFIRPFMIDLASDHYELDISRAESLLDWRPRHRLADVLPSICAALERDPIEWYRENGLTPPAWLSQLDADGPADESTDASRRGHEQDYRAEHARSRWAHFVNMGLGAWLLAGPVTHGYELTSMTVSTVISGALVIVLAALSLSWRLRALCWAQAGVGLYVMTAPLLFWAPEAAAYLDGTLVGALITGFAVAVRPTPGIAPLAERDPSTLPLGWSFSPSSWTQRVPIIALAFVGLYISRYLTAYQLEHIDAVWEPFFGGSAEDPQNGTEEIITSSVSQAWPVPDAGIGALTYMLEILTGLIGSSKRWRTMPWLVMAFGIMIVPLGAVSIFFIVIQPIVIGTWCTLCLVAAAAMLLQIPYSFDELVATTEFLWRRKRAGRSLFRVFFVGDSDPDPADEDPGRSPARRDPEDDETTFDRSAAAVIRDSFGGGVNVPWNLGLSALIGVFLMLTRLAIGSEPPMAHGDHLIGALVVTVSVTAFAEVARPVRFVNMLLGAALLGTPFLLEGGNLTSTITNLVLGAALIALAVPRGRVRNTYGEITPYLI